MALSNYHPVIIEGMGNYDPRNPAVVAQHIYEELQQHWQQQRKAQKPFLVITQGDPLSERGIAAITPRIAQMLNVSRGLVCFDPDLVPYHSPNADRSNVILEILYSDLVASLPQRSNGNVTVMEELEATIYRYLQDKNDKRQTLGKPPLGKSHCDFALLQEVTKAACFQICGEMTVAHTAQKISEFSVTSFYQVGFELGLVAPQDMVSYPVRDELDFDAIDKR